MKNNFYLILATIALTLVACETKSELTTLTNKNIALDSATTTLKINYPIAQNTQYPATADSINTFISSIVDQLPMKSDPAVINDADTLIFPLEIYMTWSATQNNKIVQFEIQNYTFTGGAHGNTLLQTKAFDPKTGRSINVLSYVNDAPKMLEIIREQISADSIPLLVPINEVPMPQYLALDTVAVTAIYNQYDIAPYSSGIIKIRMPYAQLENIFDTQAVDPTTLQTTQCPQND